MIRPQLAALVFLLAACGGDGTTKNGTPNNANDANNNDENNATDMGANNSTDGGDDGRDEGTDETGDMGPVGTTVATASGDVVGVDTDGIISFKGIPYATAPLGLQRFRPPQPHPGWDQPLEATEFGASCPQRDGMQNVFGDEDCLFLNVWTPAGSQGLPVMVFIHGGGFVQGESANPLYDGQMLAEHDVVLVSINYRLGPLGFLAAEELAAESDDDTTGNYGLMDQQAALRWVQDNIAGFGGDPGNVTIFGESAGGSSVCGHLGSPRSDGLYHRGIIQSGGGCGNYPLLRTSTLTTDASVDVGERFIEALGCADGDVAQCLRDATTTELVETAWGLSATGLGLPPFGLTIDGTVLPQQPRERVVSGEVDVPLISGSNADEATIFTAATPVPTAAAYEAFVNATFGPLAGQVLATYPVDDFDSPKDAYNNLFSDVAFICPALSFVQAAESGEPAYTYHLTRSIGLLGAFHGLDLFYVFGNFDTTPNYTPTAGDRSLRDEMMATWTGFATDGTVPWAAYSDADPQIRIFDETVDTVSEIREGRCAELQAIGITP